MPHVIETGARFSGTVVAWSIYCRTAGGIMRFATSLSLLTLLGAAGTAWGQALDDEGKPVPTTDPAAAPTTLEAKPGPSCVWVCAICAR